MGLMKCPDCGCTISDHLDVCPGCGYRPEGRNFYPGKPKSTAIPVRCPWCGEMVPAGKKNCPSCGSPAKVSYSETPERLAPVELDYTPLPIEDSRETKRRATLMLSLLAAFLALVIVWVVVTLRKNTVPPESPPTVETGGVTADAGPAASS